MIKYFLLALVVLPTAAFAQTDPNSTLTEPEKIVQQSITGFRLSIDENGTPSDCTITQSSGSAELDANACELLKGKGKFKPKIDVNGKPIKSEFNSRIVWKITE